MDKRYLVEQLKEFAVRYNVPVSDELLGTIVSGASFRVVSKGERLASIGDEAHTAGLVLHGIVRCYYIDEDGNDITRGFAPAGGVCLDEGLFGYPEHITMWEAMEESTVMFMDVAAVRSLIGTSDEFKMVWITLLENALRYKIYRENGFLTENATERYIHFKKLYPEFSSSIPLKHIATYLGIAPESLSRIRNAMKEE